MYKVPTLMTEVLEYLMKIHKSIIPKLDISERNINLSIYIISGRLLTHCYAAILLMQNGFVVEAGMIVR